MSSTKTIESFAQKNKRFYSRFTDPTVFDCAEFNILKLVQHAVVRDRSFGTFSFWLLPIILLKVVLFLKRNRLKLLTSLGFKQSFDLTDLKKYAERKYLLVDIPRTVNDENEKKVSLYFEKIIQLLGRKNLIFFLGNSGKNEAGYDFVFEQFYDELAILPLSDDDTVLLKELKQTFSRIKNETNLTSDELSRLKGAIEIFWRQYRTWREILNHVSPRAAYFVSHYQREYLILALKRKNIESIELQHGLISEEDIFYVYPEIIVPVKNKSLFADNIFVYGEYWKRVLLKGFEYAENHILIAGDYLFRTEKLSSEFENFIAENKIKEKTVILVTVQKWLEPVFEQYITWLAKDIQQKEINAFILVKPHPSAKHDISNLNKIPFVKVVNFNVESLFKVADVHLSIYSTTLYDALLFGIKNNFALYHEDHAGYVMNVVNSGVARLLTDKENPLEILNKEENRIHGDFFYSRLNTDLFRRVN